MKTRLLRIIRNLFDLRYQTDFKTQKTTLEARLKGTKYWWVYEKKQGSLSPIAQFAIDKAELMSLDFFDIWLMAEKRIKQ